MSRVIAYTYEADMHCVACTKARDDRNGFTLEDPLQHGKGRDENGVRYAATDDEGNAVHPFFSTDEASCNVCGTCSDEIEGVCVLEVEDET